MQGKLAHILVLVSLGDCSLGPRTGRDSPPRTARDSPPRTGLAWLSDSVPGVPGEDYPVLDSVESAGDTGFTCQDKVLGGYFADPSPASRCQIFHVCSSFFPSMFSFLCPNGTVFNQAYFICDWWFNVDCQQAESLYTKNQEVKEEEEDSQPIISSNQEESLFLVEEPGSIYSAIAAANDKYGAPENDIGSGDKDPVDPAYGEGVAGEVVPIPTGYGVPRGQPLSEYQPSSHSGRRGGRRNSQV